MATRKPAAAGRMTDERRWKVENALNTLTAAERIKLDRSLMRDVSRMAKQNQQVLSRVARGRKR